MQRLRCLEGRIKDVFEYPFDLDKIQPSLRQIEVLQVVVVLDDLADVLHYGLDLLGSRLVGGPCPRFFGWLAFLILPFDLFTVELLFLGGFQVVEEANPFEADRSQAFAAAQAFQESEYHLVA